MYGNVSFLLSLATPHTLPQPSLAHDDVYPPGSFYSITTFRQLVYHGAEGLQQMVGPLLNLGSWKGRGLFQRNCFGPFIDGRKKSSFSDSSKFSPVPPTATHFEHFLRFSIWCEEIPQSSRNSEKDSCIGVKEEESMRRETERER